MANCSEELCEYVHFALLEMELVRDDQWECPRAKEKKWPCDDLMTRLRALHSFLTPDKVEVIFDLIRAISPNKSPIQATPEHLTSTPFKCPELDIDIHQPCVVKSCAFYTEHNWTRNCILFYRFNHNLEKLTISELSFLLGRSATAVRKDLNRILREARQAALKETISVQAPVGEFTRISPPNICAVCERKVSKTFKKSTKYNYCSDVCYIRKPPFVLDIEGEYGMQIEQVLKICVNNFRSTKAVVQALGVTNAKLKKLCTRYSVKMP